METTGIVEGNIDKIRALFPHCITEVKGADGKIRYAVDFDKLRAELGDDMVEGQRERYQFTWPQKSVAAALANTPTRMTLRPDRESSVDFDNTENLYIEGDNLEVLKVLRETYLGQVKMIYIDPPYNTGKDFVYKDRRYLSQKEMDEKEGKFDEYGNLLFTNSDSNGRFHTDWLNFIYPRLKVARDLLTDDGVIFISIDENELDNLKKVCDEIFGQANFIAEFIWSAGRKNDSKYVSVSHEYILCYFKNAGYIKENKIVIHFLIIMVQIRQGCLQFVYFICIGIGHYIRHILKFIHFSLRHQTVRQPNCFRSHCIKSCCRMNQVVFT